MYINNKVCAPSSLSFIWLVSFEPFNLPKLKPPNPGSSLLWAPREPKASRQRRKDVTSYG